MTFSVGSAGSQILAQDLSRMLSLEIVWGQSAP
jgi:hypothetical protein